MSISFQNSEFGKAYDEFANKDLLLPLWSTTYGIGYIDQTLLPFEKKTKLAQSADDLADAIKSMQIRGSGAIGCAGAFGAALTVCSAPGKPEKWKEITAKLRSSRPTAIILQRAIDEVLETALSSKNPVSSAIKQAKNFVNRQTAMERLLGKWGSQVVPDNATILTHCNSGALAGAGYGGRVLSVIRAAKEAGKNVKVIAQETRPYLQGARITCWELDQFNIPVKLATDGMSAALIQKGLVDICIVGSDRFAANGDLVNKVGTCLIALAAQEFKVPFFASTTFYNVDLESPNGTVIPIEMRSGEEVVNFNDFPITVPGVTGIYPAFDITPAHLITGIITEKGVLTPPFHSKLEDLVLNGTNINIIKKIDKS